MVSTFEPERTPLYFTINDPPYENYFYADHNVSCQAILASPLPCTERDEDAVHRLLVAWPGGNSGAAAFFRAPSKEGSSLHIQFLPGGRGRKLDPFIKGRDEKFSSGHPSVGVSALLEFSETAILDLAILGSIRTIRDYTEGHGILNPKVQQEVRIGKPTSHADHIDITRL